MLFRSLSELQTGVTRLTHLTQQLLTLARLEPDAQSPVMQSVELSDLCKSVITDQVRRAEASGIDLGLAETTESSIPGDPETLRILLNNLVDNAIRYAGAHARIDIAVRDTGQGVVLEVCDNGPGINAAERERVLERFYRGNNQIGSGSGLGLSIVKTIAEQHGAQSYWIVLPMLMGYGCWWFFRLSRKSTQFRKCSLKGPARYSYQHRHVK